MARSGGKRYTEAMTAPDTTATFRAVFARSARRVRGRLATRIALAGATLGLLLGVGAALLAWYLREGSLRPWAAMLGAVGAGCGWLVARHKRWNDATVALYLDRQLEADEIIATAVELNGRDDDNPARATVVERATKALGAKAPKGVWPQMWRAWHGVAPVAAGAIVWLSLTQLPPAPPVPPPPPGAELVTLTDVQGLEEVIKLADLDAIDDQQAERLNKLSERAERLRAELIKGMEKREAQAQIAKLRDDIAAERMRFGTGEQRKGLEAALGKLAGTDKLKDAHRALGDRDLTAFDRDMQKLANKVEERDRAEAKKALEEAEKAARDAGASDVAEALKEQRELLDERAQRAQALRELANAFGEGLSDEAREALEQMDRSGDPGAAQTLSDEMSKALDGLSEADRKKLADKLREHAGQIDPNSADAMPMTKEQMQATELLKLGNICTY